MGFDTVSAQANLTPNWTAAINGPTAAFGAVQTTTTLQSQYKYSLGTNTAANINQIYSTVLSIAASGTATIDLRSVTNVLSTSFIFARSKYYYFGLLSTAQDSTVNTNCTQITVGNSGANGSPLNMTAIANTTSSFAIKNGERQDWATLSALGIAVASNTKDVLITNNDNTNTAKVLVTFYGADA